jgi:hypothetical protein
METMRFREKKKSYKAQIFGICIFLILGVGIICFAISSENVPAVIGSNNQTINGIVNIYEEQNALKVDDIKEVFNNTYSITNKTISDKTNVKIKANITLPVITVNNNVLTDINNEIYNKYNSNFNESKKNMAKVDNKFTYIVTYKSYENKFDNYNILSITIYERMVDDAAKKNVSEKVLTYNIDLSTGKILELDNIIIDILNSKYKDIVKTSVKDFVIAKKYDTEDKFVYSYTGLEVYYIKDNVIHLIFNPSDIVNKKYGILDIEIKE